MNIADTLVNFDHDPINYDGAVLRIALTNLHSYNEGDLDFVWLGLPCSDEEKEEAFKAIGCDPSDPETDEWFISDYEWANEFEEISMEVGEYESIDHLCKLAERLDDLKDEAEKIIAVIEATNYDLAYVLDHIDDYVFYQGQTLEDVARELVEDGAYGDIPEAIKTFIDFKAIARDLSYSDYSETSKGTVFAA